MEEIDKEKFDSAKDLPSVDAEVQPRKLKQPTKEEMEILFKQMQDPVNAQQEIAAKIKNFLDNRMELEITNSGSLSSNTRMWVETYNNLLEKIQKAMHGEKSVNLHMVKVSHSDISEKIRESIYDLEKVEETEEEKKKKKAIQH